MKCSIIVITLFCLWLPQHLQAKKSKKSKKSEEIPKLRSSNSTVPLTEQVGLEGGTFWFGSQMMIEGKIGAKVNKDGADAPKKVTVKPFLIDIDCVTNTQFQDFVNTTKYLTESEFFGWSFVLDNQVSETVRKHTDSKKGMGRVKDAKHWLAVRNAHWNKPYGGVSDLEGLWSTPVVHMSLRDATAYCSWAGRRLPTEWEWEFAARAGRSKQNFPWGDKAESGRMNIWEGKNFPKNNSLQDGYLGPAPVLSYPPNDFGLYNMLGNVWEWVQQPEGSPQGVLRGGSFLDSIDGSFNHAVRVSTRQLLSVDSGASNLGFRCVSDVPVVGNRLDDAEL